VLCILFSITLALCDKITVCTPQICGMVSDNGHGHNKTYSNNNNK